MNKQIQHKLFYEHKPQIVWDYLTKPELMEQWLMKTDFKPVVGHEFKFLTRPMPDFNFNGVIQCKVLELIPLKKLSYSWKGGGNDNEITLDSTVIWTLREKDNGTELELVHDGFKEADVTMFGIMNQGWIGNMHKIDNLISAIQTALK